MPTASLPRYRADAWPGGFTVASPVYTASISAVDGMVVAATELIYRLRPGAMAFQTREPPQGTGDVAAVAVEPRRPRREQRIAVAGMHELHLLSGEGVASMSLAEEDGEIVQLLWGPMLWTPDDWKPAVPAGEPIDVLYVRCESALFVLLPDGSPFGALGRYGDGPVASASALATDGAGGFAFVCVDQETCEVEVSTLAEREPQLWHTRNFEGPTTMCDLQLAVAGKSLAVSFGFDGVYLTRDCMEHEFTEIEELRGRLDSNDRPEAAPIAFEGSADDAALFAAVRDTKAVQHIVRVDAAGHAQRIAEVELETNDETQLRPPIHALAWDGTRSTLWSAAGKAGIMRSTAPGAPSWLPARAAS